MGLGAFSYPSIRKQALVENTSKEIILYSINKQDNYALVHKNVKGGRFDHGSFPEYLVGIVRANHQNVVCTLSFVESLIICCENFAVFAAYSWVSSPCAE